MAVLDTLFGVRAPDGAFFVPADSPVVLEKHCPDCGTALLMRTMDPRTTAGYSVPFVYCTNQCDLSHSSSLRG